MKPARLRPQARQDRLAETRHYRDAAGCAAAEVFVMSAEQALDLLEQQPGLGSPRLGQLLDIQALRSWRISGFPLMWLYIEQSDHLDVVRLLGERQDLLAILGEAKTPDALQNASDQFFMWHAPEPPEPAEASGADAKPATTPPAPAPLNKRRPKALLDAVALMAESTSDGKVGLGALGQYMKRTKLLSGAGSDTGCT